MVGGIQCRLQFETDSAGVETGRIIDAGNHRLNVRINVKVLIPKVIVMSIR